MSSLRAFLLQHRAVIIGVSTTAAVLSIILLSSTSRHPQTQTPLRRSNAIRRSRRIQIDVETEAPTAESLLGAINIISPAHETLHIVIANACLPQRRTLENIYQISNERAGWIYDQVLIAAVRSILSQCDDDDFALLFEDEAQWRWLYQLRSDLEDLDMGEVADRNVVPVTEYLQADDPGLVHHTITYTREQNENEDPRNKTTDADQLKGVLYYIAEEQAKRKAYFHRGIRCEECGESPIRNIRWHCLNCADFDLCSTCKSLTAHQKNHIFAEIKIPVPVLAQPTGVLPIWYPGDDTNIDSKLSATDRRKLAQTYDYEEPELDALADQFCCLSDMLREGDLLGTSISPKAFAKALCHEKRRTQWRSNMIVERMFAFYDTERIGEISFDAFVSGVAYLRGKHRFASLDRAVRGFDLEGDGLICRSQFVQLLRSKFDAHRLLVEEVAEFEEAEHTRQIIPWRTNGQPIGVAFQGDIPDGGPRASTGKVLDDHGDLIPEAGRQIILEDVHLRATENLLPSSTTVRSQELSDEERQLLGLTTQAGQDRRHRQTNEELLWDIIEAAINETLDKIFEPVERRMAQVVATKDERLMWKEEIQQAAREQEQYKKRLEASSDLDPLLATANEHNRAKSKDITGDEILTLEQSLREGMVSTNTSSLEEMEREIKSQSLQHLLDSIGYAVVEDKQDTLPRRDPTMPQNRPNAVVAVADEPHTPSHDRLLLLADIESDAQRMHIRDGQACLEIKEIEAIARADESREVEGLIKSWLSWAAF